MKNFESENLRNRRKVKEHSLFLDVVVTIISIISSMNGLMNILEGWFDPLGKLSPVMSFGGMNLTTVDLIGGVLGLAIGLGIGLLFKTLSESMGLTVSENKRGLIFGSLLMLGAVDTLLIAYGQYAGYQRAMEYRYELVNAEKNQVRVEAYESAKENVSLIKAQIAQMQRELLKGSESNAAATAALNKEKLLKKEILAIKKRFDTQRKAYGKSDAKNQNWINIQEAKAIKAARERIKVIDPVKASMQYKDMLQKKIDLLIAKKGEYLKQQQKASEEIRRSSAPQSGGWLLMAGALLIALGFKYFEYRINKLKGDAKQEYEVGVKILKRRMEREKNGASEEMSPLMKRMEEAKRKGANFSYVTPEKDMNTPAMDASEAMMLDKVKEISDRIGERDGMDLQKAPFEALKEEMNISDYTHRKIVEYGVNSGKLFQKVPRGAYYFKEVAEATA